MQTITSLYNQLQITTSDYKSLRVRLHVIVSYYKIHWLRSYLFTGDYEWLKVTKSQITSDWNPFRLKEILF